MKRSFFFTANYGLRTARFLLALLLLAPAAFAADWPAGVDSPALDTLALAHEGRVMILDTRARDLLWQIAGPVEFDGESPAITLLDLVCRDDARRRPLIYINYLPFKQRLVAHLPADQRERLLPRRSLLRTADLPHDDFESVLMDAIRSGDSKMRDAIGELEEALMLLQPDRLAEELQIVPPAAGESGRLWRTPAELPTDDPAAAAWADLSKAFADEDASAVAAAGQRLSALLAARGSEAGYPPAAVRQIELFYNRSGKLTVPVIAYLAAAVLFLAAGLLRWRWLRPAAAAMLAAALLLHAAVFVMRGVIAGYVPLTNMYESLLLAAWVVGAAALALGARRKPALPAWAIGAAGAFLAAILCLLTNFVGIGQGRIGAQTAILRSAWLTYHVLTIMTGYAFILLALVVSLVYLVMRLCKQPEERMAALDRANLILVKLAFLFVLAGILTGSVWADAAWGRWWGWDAKETMSLVTLLVYTILLHVRHFVKDKGLATAILSVVGVASMAMTWSVNFLISGSLHSYV